MVENISREHCPSSERTGTLATSTLNDPSVVVRNYLGKNFNALDDLAEEIP